MNTGTNAFAASTSPVARSRSSFTSQSCSVTCSRPCWATPLRRFTGDGAYNTRRVYTAVGEAGGPGVKVVVPLRRPATASVKTTGPWIAEIGRQAWQKKTGYRQQARVEGTFLRYKRILGGSLHAKGFEAQQREAMVGCTVLNKMLAFGEAESSALAE